MKYIDRNLQQNILYHLIDGKEDGGELAFEMHRYDKNDSRIFDDSIEDLLKRGIIEWNPLNKNVPEDELIHHDSSYRIYHIATPKVIKYFQNSGNKIHSTFFNR